MDVQLWMDIVMLSLDDQCYRNKIVTTVITFWSSWAAENSDACSAGNSMPGGDRMERNGALSGEWFADLGRS